MAKHRKTVTMSDIAEKLRVSTVTVSKALSGQKGVSDAVREEILELARQMGYEAPASSKRKLEQKSFQIGVLISERYLGDITSFYWKMYQEISEYAMQKFCYTMFEGISESMEEEKRLPRLIEEQKVDAVMVVGRPGYHYDDFLRDHVKLPMVFLDFYPPDAKVDSFISDGFYGTYRLTDYLLKKGHRDIAYVGTLFATESITDRYLGYVKALLEQGITPDPSYLIDDSDLYSGLRDKYKSFCLPEKLPTAFVCNCDYIASVLVKNLREQGIRVPEDVSVVGFDDFISPHFCEIPLTTYGVDIPSMVKQAFHALLEKMDGVQREAGIHIVEGYLVERDSVRERV